MKLRKILLTLALFAMCVGQASALEFTYDAPEDYLFGRPTSQNAPYVEDDPNVDRSKNVALVPPGFGTPTSYLPGSGEHLTPNMVPGALNGGLVNQIGSVNYPAIDNGAQAPSASLGGITMTQIPGSPSGIVQGGSVVGFTNVTDDLYYSGGHLGTLKIPAIGLSVKVYQGTDSKTLAKGAGHFPETSIWNGNCCLAAHNRGVSNHFGKIHTLEPGDTVTLTTKLGTRTYAVSSVEKVSETDTSGTASTADNRLTLYTCVRDERDFRWKVTAVEQ